MLKQKYIYFLLGIGVFATTGILLLRQQDKQPLETVASSTSEVSGETVLEEVSEMARSMNATWWLNSGGRVYFEKNTIKTIQGELPENDPWRLKYNDYNAAETDNGYHPQNIFRLVTKAKYANPVQSIYFKINRYILSTDSHRTASNGVLFFERYLDGDNLYYAGLRVDGLAVIKKKKDGIYYTMVYRPVFIGSKYDRGLNPNLLPVGKYVGIKSEIINLDSNRVWIKLYMDNDSTGQWELVAETIDDGKSFGGAAFMHEGYAGIRTDFMDVEFEDYSIAESN